MIKRYETKHAFTLAEMMVVMLVLTIILAATAPLMTKKRPASMDNPWRYATNLSDAYFGSAGNQTAMLGQSSKASSDLDAKLLINNTTATYPYINFKNGSTSMADLMINGNSLVFGGPYSSSNAFGMGSNNGNAAFGVRSLWKANTSAKYDTAIGYEALKYNTSGEANTAVGFNALGNATTANANTAVGHFALAYHKGGTNAALGYAALHGIDSSESNTGVNNTGVGAEAGRRITSGSDNTAVGFASLGAGLWTNTTGVTGDKNTAVGAWSMNAISTGYYNTSVGHESMKNVTEGSYNAALGQRALYSNTLGKFNTAIGTRALRDNIGVNKSVDKIYSGDGNTAVGYRALELNLGNSGAYEGASNTAVGTFSMEKNRTGSGNTAIGYNSLSSNESGSNNIAIGNGACKNVTGSYKTCIGYASGPSSSDDNASKDNKVIYLGDSETTVYIPGNIVVDNRINMGYIGKNGQKNFYALNIGPVPYQSSISGLGWSSTSKSSKLIYVTTPNTSTPFSGSKPFVTGILYQGNYGGSTNPKQGADGDIKYMVYDTAYVSDSNGGGQVDIGAGHKVYTSDKRLKNIKGENKAGLEQIRKLKVFDYSFKADKSKTPRVGVIAQDLQKVFPNAVVKSHDGFLMIRQEDMFYAMINAIKQLDTIVQALITEVKVDLAKVLKHDAEIKQLQNENEKLQAKNAELEKRIEKLEKAMSK